MKSELQRKNNGMKEEIKYNFNEVIFSMISVSMVLYILFLFSDNIEDPFSVFIFSMFIPTIIMVIIYIVNYYKRYKWKKKIENKTLGKKDIIKYIKQMEHFTDSYINEDFTNFEFDFLKNKYNSIVEVLNLDEEETPELFNNDNLEKIEEGIKKDIGMNVYLAEIQIKTMSIIIYYIKNNKYRQALNEILDFINKKDIDTFSEIEKKSLKGLFELFFKKLRINITAKNIVNGNTKY